jgi:hypothetical protein
VSGARERGGKAHGRREERELCAAATATAAAARALVPPVVVVIAAGETLSSIFLSFVLSRRRSGQPRA